MPDFESSIGLFVHILYNIGKWLSQNLHTLFVYNKFGSSLSPQSFLDFYDI